MAPVIVAKDLFKCYAGFAPVLRGVNLEVVPGEMVAIMGPSGCGKSTMLHVLGMLHAPDSGSLEILGQDVLTFDREQTAAFRRGNMGFVMQASNLFDHSTVFENVEFPLIYEQVPPQERWERVIRALELVRLSARVHYRSNRLSGGEQQRVAIARAMVNNPRILLADEPTGALDAKTSRLIMNNFRTLCHTGGVAMVMVTHDPKMADFCDSIYTLEEGLLRCQRHNLPEVSADGSQELLRGRSPVVRGAMVAERFPEISGQCTMDEAHRMHTAGLLSRIYALRSNSLLGNPEGYALPLAVRRIGMFSVLSALARLFRLTGEEGARLRRLRHSLPGKGRWGRRWWNHLRAFCAGIALAGWGREEGIEFFYAAGAHGPATAAWVASRLLGVPFAFAVRAADVAQPGLDWSAMGTDAVFVRCDTEATCALMREMLPQLAGKLEVLRDPLTLTPSEDEQESSASAGGNDDDDKIPALLAVGTLAKRKGYDVLLRACAILRLDNTDVHLTFVGQGPEKLHLRWLAWRLGLRRSVKFVGQIAHENMADMYNRADIFVAPGCKTHGGEADGLPSALVEALASGLAVVASDLPGHAEAVQDGVNGRLVPQNNPGALADALRELSNDTMQRKRLGEAARVSVEGLVDAERTDARLSELIKNACAKA
ncbi:glycosyltransferase [uncultured Desulfovibrio sp.]|uniref:glycosyltransferase n=1 Tax=uncultured Desulfovibrio sp. TaxID=167968 RepID=UPI0026026C20|nr:glycosyltransferase [uncultured Desulfovibrio sp.]